MSFLNNLTAYLPFKKKEEKKEFYFAVNIETENLICALWTIEGKELKILSVASQKYSSEEEIIAVLDKLLDDVLGFKEEEPQKILFGVPNSWITEDNLKDEYLKILRNIVKELELAPMAYVAIGNALVHFLEKKDGVPATAILAGFEKEHLAVAVTRAGKLDGVRLLKRSGQAGVDIEKALFQFRDVETLPSKILIYGREADELKSELISFPWMSKLSFLHFPKIEVLEENISIKSICLAAASEINSNIKFHDEPIKKQTEGINVLKEETPQEEDIIQKEESADKDKDSAEEFGFMVGDISEKEKNLQEPQEKEETQLSYNEEPPPPPSPFEKAEKEFAFKRFIPKKLKKSLLIVVLPALIVFLFGLYVFFARAEVKVFVEPKVLEKDAQVVADPNQREVNENEKIIPAQIIETEVSGKASATATGKKQIGEPAKGTIVVYNKTADSQTLSRGAQVTGSGGLKFTLDNSITIASQSASDSGITFGKVNAKVTASAIGADGNLPSGSNLTINGFSADKLGAKAEGNFSGGTSKDVTVVSAEDSQQLLAKLSGELKQQAQQKLQEKYPSKKVLKEALAENIVRKSYSKNVNDQAGEFSLNMTAHYKGTAFDDADLRVIVSKLVTTDVPEGFRLDLSGTETQADVSSLEKNGKLVFAAKFKAKLLPIIDTDVIKNKIKFKSILEAGRIIKNMENILNAEIKINPQLPSIFARMPFLSKNIKLDVGLK